jgi:hypothetical protein
MKDQNLDWTSHRLSDCQIWTVRFAWSNQGGMNSQSERYYFDWFWFYIKICSINWLRERILWDVYDWLICDNTGMSERTRFTRVTCGCIFKKKKTTILFNYFLDLPILNIFILDCLKVIVEEAGEEPRFQISRQDEDHVGVTHYYFFPPNRFRRFIISFFSFDSSIRFISLILM